MSERLCHIVYVTKFFNSQVSKRGNLDGLKCHFRSTITSGLNGYQQKGRVSKSLSKSFQKMDQRGLWTRENLNHQIFESVNNI